MEFRVLQRANTFNTFYRIQVRSKWLGFWKFVRYPKESRNSAGVIIEFSCKAGVNRRLEILGFPPVWEPVLTTKW